MALRHVPGIVQKSNVAQLLHRKTTPIPRAAWLTKSALALSAVLEAQQPKLAILVQSENMWTQEPLAAMIGGPYRPLLNHRGPY